MADDRESLGDRDLVRLAKEGDERAFRTLVERHQRRTFQLALGVVRDGDAAMDVVQEAFIKVHKYLGDFKGDASFSTWLHRITVNLAIDQMRRERARGGVTIAASDAPQELDEDLVSDLPMGQPPPAPDAALMNRELSEELESALSQLPEKHRAILVLREVEGLTYEELSDTLGIRKGTVMSRLFHARAKLQKLLGGSLGRRS